jgi:hypothetical protein
MPKSTHLMLVSYILLVSYQGFWESQDWQERNILPCLSGLANDDSNSVCPEAEHIATLNKPLN